MNKKTTTISIILILIIAGGFWYVNNGQNRVYTGQVSKVQSQKPENQNNVIPEKSEIQEEKTDENIEELKIEDTKNVKSEFGIDDSGLRYNKDGSVDMSDWKEYVSAVKFKYPKSWVNTGDGISNLNNFEKPMPSKQIYISSVGFGVPFEIEDFIRKYPELNHDKILKMAVDENIASTKKYVGKYQGECKVTSVNDLNVYIVCKYTKDAVVNILYQRTFVSDKYLDDKDNVTGGIIGLNIKAGSEALKNNKKIITTILENAYIDNIIGNKSLILDKVDFK